MIVDWQSDPGKFDQFAEVLAKSHDLLYAVIDAKACIEIIANAANQNDKYLRLSSVVAKQIEEKTGSIEAGCIFQADRGVGVMERKVFEVALKHKAIDLEAFDRLNELYTLRNCVIYRCIISDIKIA